MGRSDDELSFSCVCQVAPRVNVRKTLDKLLGAAEKIYNSCVSSKFSFCVKLEWPEWPLHGARGSKQFIF